MRPTYNGKFVDFKKLTVNETLNGAFELEAEFTYDEYVNAIYPYDDDRYGQFRCETDDVGTVNLFDGYSVIKKGNGLVSIKARHISYKLSKFFSFPVEYNGKFSLGNAIKEMQGDDDWYVYQPHGEQETISINPFIGAYDWTSRFSLTNIAQWDKTKEIDLTSSKSKSMRDWIWGSGGLIETFGVSVKFEDEGRKIVFCGDEDFPHNQGFIKYGINMVDIKDTARKDKYLNLEGVFPYAHKSDGTMVLGNKIPNQYVDEVLPYNFTNEANEYLQELIDGGYEATEDDVFNSSVLTSIGRDWWEKKGQYQLRGETKSVYAVAANLSQTTEYANLHKQTSFRIGDFVSVKNEKIGTEATVRCTRTKFDVLNKRYLSVEFGDKPVAISDTVANLVRKGQK